eukprot:gene16328-biopygen15813
MAGKCWGRRDYITWRTATATWHDPWLSSDRPSSASLPRSLRQRLARRNAADKVAGGVGLAGPFGAWVAPPDLLGSTQPYR